MRRRPRVEPVPSASQELAVAYATGKIDLEALEAALPEALAIDESAPALALAPDRWYLDNLELLTSAPPHPTAGTLVVRAHVVLEANYRALLVNEATRSRSLLDRTGMLSIGIQDEGSGQRRRPSKVFIASYRNPGNGFHAYCYSGPSLDEALRVLNAFFNSSVPRAGRRRPWMSREDFDKRFRALAGLTPA